MTELLTNPLVIAGGLGVLTAAGAAAYSYLTGNSADVGVDIDDDGNDDVTASFGGEENTTPPEYETEADSTVPDSLPESLEDVTGIGPSKAEKLRSVGYESPEDLYNASDSELESINTFGPAVVEQIRGDVGSVEEGASDSPSSDGEEIGSVEDE